MRLNSSGVAMISMADTVHVMPAKQMLEQVCTLHLSRINTHTIMDESRLSVTAMLQYNAISAIADMLANFWRVFVRWFYVFVFIQKSKKLICFTVKLVNLVRLQTTG
jgi:hypothetical protein